MPIVWGEGRVLDMFWGVESSYVSDLGPYANFRNPRITFKFYNIAQIGYQYPKCINFIFNQSCDGYTDRRSLKQLSKTGLSSLLPFALSHDTQIKTTQMGYFGDRILWISDNIPLLRGH